MKFIDSEVNPLSHSIQSSDSTIIKISYLLWSTKQKYTGTPDKTKASATADD